MIVYPNLNILSCNDSNNYITFVQDICSLFQNIDIFYYPDYVSLFEFHGEGEAKLLIYYESPERIVINPFILRKINKITIFNNLSDDLYDIISPYGYTGYLRNNDQIDMNKFFSVFKSYCQENNIVSEFVRFNPFLENSAYAPAEVAIQKWNDTVSIDISQDEEMIWKDMSSERRNRIRKAINNNINIIEDDKLNNLNEFCDIYYHTMDNVNAQQYYYFTKEWFNQLAYNLKGKATLYHAIYNDSIIASALMIYQKSIAHYYLGGTLYEMRKLEPFSLLLYRAAIGLKSKGFKLFNLGGGLSQNDSLFQYKAKFSKLTAKYYIAKNIYNKEIYQYLTLLRSAQEPQYNGEPYFPAYRGPNDANRL